MNDLERLINDAGSPEARLLSAACDEPPPADLLARTLEAVGAAVPAGVVAGGAAAKAGAGVGVGAAKAAGGGILGAAAAGALAGLLVVAGYGLVGGAGTGEGVSPPAPAALSTGAGEPPARTHVLSPEPAPPASPEPSAASPQRAIGAASAARPTALAAELELLDEARRALRAGDRAGARALLDQYARRIPRGQLAREAERLRAEIEAESREGGAGETIP